MYVEIDDIKKAQNQTLNVKFDKIIKDLDEKNPVKAALTLKLLENIIIVTGKIQGKISSVCERCLKEFNREIDIEIDEKFMLGNLHGGEDGEIELKEDDFIEELGSKHEIDIEDLIYQSVILNSPNQIVCDINCRGGALLQSLLEKKPSDPRLEVFKNIKLEKDN